MNPIIKLSRASVSTVVCILMVIAFSTISAVGVYAFLQKSPTPVTAQTPPVTTPSAMSAQETAVLFVKDITSTSSNRVPAKMIASLSELLRNDMYKAAFLPSSLEGSQMTASAVSPLESDTVISDNTASAQVQVCYDVSCYMAWHYYVTLVIENNFWVVSGVTAVPESRE